ncbi:MAG: DUF3189 family protein [Peptococcaceae bacterium]|nr:DUF3189 family protein [Peptococcaceae bacterium]
MKIIYNCYGGSHSSVTSAAIHLGLLQCDSIPCKEELWRLPLYDKQVKKDHGTLNFMGTDELENAVYVVGRRSMGKPAQRALNTLAQIYAIPQNDFMLVDPMPFVNWAMKIGGITSRRLGLVAIGRPVVTWGNRKAYPHLAGLVKRVKANLSPAVPLDYHNNGARAVIYCDYTGRHQAAVAATLHLNRDFHAMQTPRVKVGEMFHWGDDAEGNQIYSQSVSYENELLPKLMREFAKLYEISEAQLTLVDLVGMAKYAYGIGAVIEAMPGLGRRTENLFTHLNQRNLGQIRDIVELTKSTLASPAG